MTVNTAVAQSEDEMYQNDVERIESCVKWFNPEKGYGFLEPTENEEHDIFMHFSVLDAAGFRRVEEGDVIDCDVSEGRQGRQVVRIWGIKFAPRQPKFAPAFMGGRGAHLDPESLEEIQGEIKWFNPLKGYGFICPDDGGRDIFLHASVLRALGLESVDPGVMVRAKVTGSERGREARVLEFI